MSLLRRRMMLASRGGKSVLPRAYQQVEYVEKAEIGPYIHIPFAFQNNEEVTVILKLVTGTGEQGFFGAEGKYDLYYYNADLRSWTTKGEDVIISRKYSETQDTVRAYIKYLADYVDVFHYKPDRYLFSGRIFSVVFTRNGQEVINLVSCYRKSDGDIGMYDTVNGTFYTNAGTGAFTKGADVN